MHPGQGPGLSLHDLGESSGSETVSLLVSEMPGHTHIAQPKTSLGNQQVPTGKSWAGSNNAKQYVNTAPNTTMNPLALNPAGGSQPHNNLPPYLFLNFIIALQGVYPPRS
jgi:microcystin-dependent protein